MTFNDWFWFDKIIEEGKELGKKIAALVGLGLLFLVLTTNLAPTEPISPDAPTYEYYWTTDNVMTNLTNYTLSTGCEIVDSTLCSGISTACKKIPYHLCGIDRAIPAQGKDCITCDFSLKDVPYAVHCMQCEISELPVNLDNKHYFVGIRKK